MGFVYDEEPKKARATSRRGVVPIESLGQMGCRACPRDAKGEHQRAIGESKPDIYVLTSEPGSDDAAIKEVERFLPRSIRDGLTYGTTVQCSGKDKLSDVPAVLACCNPRTHGDIEDAKPLVVVGIGDWPLKWSTGLGTAITWRGTPIPAKFGSHACWYYPLIEPRYLNSNKRQTSEFEHAMVYDVRRLRDLYDDGAFDKPPVIESGPYDRGIELITGQEQGDIVRLEEGLHRLLDTSPGFDIETNGLRPYELADPRILTASLCDENGGIAFAVQHPDGWGTETRERKVLGMLGEFLAQSGRKVCHNVGFEMEWAAYFYGTDLLRRTEWEDTMALAWAHDERPGTKSLDAQTVLHFGFNLKAQSPIDVKVANWWTLHSIRAALRYNGMDALWSKRLFVERHPQLDERELGLYERQMQIAPNLVLTSARGMPFDREFAQRMFNGFESRMAAAEEKLRKTAEIRKFTAQFGTFSVTNDDHVMKLMRDVLKRPEVAETDYSGKVSYSVDEEHLLLMDDHEVPSAPLILEHRSLRRNNTTYLGPLLEGQRISRDGLIRYEYSSMHTVTGRMSSPSHNWPKHKHREVRGAVAAKPPEWFVACDYGQIEFRVAGMLSGDEAIIKACWTGYDVHKFWGQRALDVWPGIKDAIVAEYDIDWDEKGAKTLRQHTKNAWVFPLLFGATWQGCAARMLNMPDDAAESLSEEFWDTFSEHSKWQAKEVDRFEKRLYAETLGGFRRHGPMTRNELINAPIQGTACEIVVAGWNAVSERADAEGNEELQPIFNGHDDLTFRIDDSRIESSVQTIAWEMTKPRMDYVCVPLIVEVSVGPRWSELEEIAKFSSEHMHNHRNPYK